MSIREIIDTSKPGTMFWVYKDFGLHQRQYLYPTADSNAAIFEDSEQKLNVRAEWYESDYFPTIKEALEYRKKCVARAEKKIDELKEQYKLPWE